MPAICRGWTEFVQPRGIPSRDAVQILDFNQPKQSRQEEMSSDQVAQHNHGAYKPSPHHHNGVPAGAILLALGFISRLVIIIIVIFTLHTSIRVPRSIHL